jgi:hypothetical protein
VVSFLLVAKETPTTETKIEGGAQQPIPNVAELPQNVPNLGGDEG